jgi:hypothetical protein
MAARGYAPASRYEAEAFLDRDGTRGRFLDGADQVQVQVQGPRGQLVQPAGHLRSSVQRLAHRLCDHVHLQGQPGPQEGQNRPERQQIEGRGEAEVKPNTSSPASPRPVLDKQSFTFPLAFAFLALRTCKGLKIRRE